VRVPELRIALQRSLEDLAAIGEKRVGTPAGLRAAAYLQQRFVALGMSPTLDPFHFPRHDVAVASLDVTIGGATRPIGYDPFEGCGSGRVRAEIVDVAWADDREKLRDLAGKVALVERNVIYHRSTQYLNVAEAGAVAMLVVSTAPGNLRQVGSVRRAWEAIGPIPALAIGSADGHILRTSLAANQRVIAELAVDAQVTRGCGQNVIAEVAGDEPSHIVVGAHYDSWFAGATDNGGGVAALLALAERWNHRRPRYGVTFVAWDGEEIALYGGYHHLRRSIAAAAPVLAVVDLETPSAHGAQAYGLARSNQPLLERAITTVGLHDLFAMNVPMELVPELFGGVIPTDIQGVYRSGRPTMSTAGDSPYYHTVEDTPDKVDLARLAELTDGFDRMLMRLMAEPLERFAARDPALWRAEVRARAHEGSLLVDVRVRDGAGQPQSAANVDCVLFHDHFFETAARSACTDADGSATLRFPAGLLDRPAPRFLHVTAGRKHPLVEEIVPLD
jgi:hypothetical protein